MWLKFLRQGDIEKIHSASLRVLEEVGVSVQDPDFLKFLGNAGANVDYDRKRAGMSEALVNECMKKAPRQLTFYARDAKHDVKFENGKIYAHPTGGAANVLDLDSGTARPANRKDVEDLTKVVDALPNIHTQVMIVYPSDVPERLRDIHAVDAVMRNTGKNFDATPYNDESFRFIIDMIVAVQGEEEFRREPIIINK